MRTKSNRETKNLDHLKFGLTTLFLHVSFYCLIVFILLFFMELFS